MRISEFENQMKCQPRQFTAAVSEKKKTSSLPSAKDENVEPEASQKLQPQNNYRSLKAGPKETKKKEKNSRGAGSAIEL